MAEIRWTEEAVLWLQKIFNYIIQDNPDAAQRVVQGIYDKAQILKTFPEIGYKYRIEPEGEIRILLSYMVTIGSPISINIVQSKYLEFFMVL